MIQSSSRSNRSISHGYLLFLIFFSFLVFTFLLIFPLHEGYCAQVTLAWDPDSAPDLVGYKIYYGTISGNYQGNIDVGNVNTYTLNDLTIGETYYAVATAYTASGLESNYSNEVMFTVSSCTYAISPSSANFPAFGGTGSVNITTPSYCNWTTSSSIPWITVTPGSGLGSGTMSYTVDSNTGTTSRTASLSIAGNTYTVIQAGQGQTVYTINASAGTSGAISPSGTVTVLSGAGQSFTITPNTGYTITDVKVDGVSQGAITFYFFSNVQANRTITASFTASTYTAISPPDVTTGIATSITGSSVTLKGIVNPNGSATTYYVEWGTTTSYGNATGSQWAGSGTSNISVSNDLTGLTPNTIYHYRFVANSSAGTSDGADKTFPFVVSGDYDGDGNTDLMVWRPGDGKWYKLNVQSGSVTVQQWGEDHLKDIPVIGDYDGDKKVDIAVWRPGDGNWYIRNSATGTVTTQQWGAGALRDVPVPGDYDGDGKTDIAVWRPGNGNWYIRNSATGTVTTQQWGSGALGDVPVPGDYDGDGKTDIAVWRPGVGKWYIRNTATGTITVQQWGSGALGDIPVPGDYDGDGKTDIAVWRPGDGNWYIRNSATGTMTVQQWGSGALGDIPVPGDYDGDGKTDMAVWRPGDGNWYILRSSDGAVEIRQWGDSILNDIPISSNTILYRQMKGLLY